MRSLGLNIELSSFGDEDEDGGDDGVAIAAE